MLYLRLTHGRTKPGPATDEDGVESEGWGFDGPIIGPLDWVHTTYAVDVFLGYKMEGDTGGMDYELSIVDGLLRYDGKFYGDWEVFHAATPPDGAEMPDADKANNPGVKHSKFHKPKARKA